MKKFIIPLIALLSLFAVAEASAQICAYDENHKYKLEDAIQYKGEELDFIKFCCEELGKCTSGYAARGHYYLTHIAAMYKHAAVLKYLVEDRHIPKDDFPAFVKPGDNVEYRTPVMMSAVRGDYASTKYLVDLGVNITRKDRDQKSAYDYAVASGNQKLVDYMKPFWRKAKGYSYNQIEKEKAKLKNLLRPAAIQNAIAQNKTLQTTKPFQSI